MQWSCLQQGKKALLQFVVGVLHVPQARLDDLTADQTQCLPAVPTCASLLRFRFSSTSREAMGKLRSMDSKALRVMTITRTVLRDLQQAGPDSDSRSEVGGMTGKGIHGPCKHGIP